MYTLPHIFRRICMALPCLTVAVCLLMSCTQDNVHMPEGGAGQETWETYTKLYSGVLSSTVPVMQEYLDGPVRTEMTVRVGPFHAAHSGYVTVCTQAFSIDDPFVTEMMGMPINVGEMEIKDVEYAAFPGGGGYFRKDAFDVQAGTYRTRGSLYGELSPEGQLNITLTFRPGSMPFEIVSEFY